MVDLPLVSIVTPSLNMGRFLRETIQSVLSQDYPRIEYIVMDGGSTDDTLQILKEFEGKLEYYSGPDGGTADAINRGLQRSHGTIFTFLNADDAYLPGAVSRAVAELLENPSAGVVYGDAYWTDGNGQTLGAYPTRTFELDLLGRECFICQPAAFLRRTVFEQAGCLDPDLQFTFDYDLWIRVARFSTLRKIDGFLAASRMHKDNKTVGQRRQVLEETLRMLQRNVGYVPFDWVHAYACYRIDGRDQFFEPTSTSFLKYLLSLFYGLAWNSRQPWRFTREWAAVMSFRGFVRRCQVLLGLPNR
jgi:glycosyltransferase involved in cell wall biosynthesis